MIEITPDKAKDCGWIETDYGISENFYKKKIGIYSKESGFNLNYD